MKNGSKKWNCFFNRDIFLVLIGVLIIISGYYELLSGSPETMDIYDVSKDWKLILSEERSEKIDLTLPFDHGGRNMILLEKRLTPRILETGNLIFFSEDMGVLVYFDHYEIYRFGSENDFLNTKKFYGSKWHRIKIPASAREGDDIKLVLIPNGPIGEARLPRVYAADDHEFSSFLIHRNQFAIGYSFLVCILALIAIGYYLVNKRNIDLSDRIIYVGLFALLAFIWFFSKNIWIRYVFANEEFLKMLSFTASCLMVLPIFWTISGMEKFGYKSILSLLIHLVLIYTVAKLSLYLVFDRDVYDMSGIELAAKIVVGGIYIVLLVADHRKNKDPEVGSMILPSLIFFAVVVIDLFHYRASMDRLRSWVVELGTLVSMLIMTAEAIYEIRIVQDRSIWAEYYRSIMGLDTMTGLENQDAFIQTISDLENYETIGVIAIDMNDLKKTNDTLGHAAGDELILALSELMKSSFAEGFRRFRLGGDEFIILSQGRSKDMLEKMLQFFYDKIEEYNARNGTDLGVAAGVAIFDRRKDSDLKDLLRRADEKMYRRKNAMKIG